MDLTSWVFLHGAGAGQLLKAVGDWLKACPERDQLMDMLGLSQASKVCLL